QATNRPAILPATVGLQQQVLRQHKLHNQRQNRTPFTENLHRESQGNLDLLRKALAVVRCDLFGLADLNRIVLPPADRRSEYISVPPPGQPDDDCRKFPHTRYTGWFVISSDITQDLPAQLVWRAKAPVILVA